MQVIKIGAVWCSTCLVMRPRWQQIEDKYSWLKTKYFDYDQDQAQIEPYQINSQRLPVFIILDKQGQEIERLDGELSLAEIDQLVLKYKHK